MVHQRLTITLLVVCTWMQVFSEARDAVAQTVWEEDESLRAEFEKLGLQQLIRAPFGSTREGDNIWSLGARYDKSFDGQTLQDLPRIDLPFGLNLNGTGITDQTLAELGKQPNLVAITLSGTSISDEGIAALRSCTRLEIIDVSETRITARGLFHLREREVLKVKVDPEVITHQDFQVFAQLGGNHAWILDVSQTPEVFRALRQAGKRHWWPEVEAQEEPRRPSSELEIAKLRFRGEAFGDREMEDLEDLTCLTYLDLVDSSLGDSGAETLAKLVSLQWLNLSRSRITDAGIAKLSTLSELLYLNLAGTAITDTAMDTVQGFSHLRDLDLSGTSVTSKAVSRLANIETLGSIDLFNTAISLDDLVLFA